MKRLTGWGEGPHSWWLKVKLNNHINKHLPYHIIHVRNIYLHLVEMYVNVGNIPYLTIHGLFGIGPPPLEGFSQQ